MFGFILDFFFPPQCIICLKFVSSFGTLCSKCWSNINFLSDRYCYSCGVAFYSTIQKDLCPKCFVYPPPFQSAKSVFAYNDYSKRAIERFKFLGCTYSAPIYAKWMVKYCSSIFKAVDLIVPVPLHISRLRMRKYNQSVLIAKNLSDITKIPINLNSLFRVKKTDSQVGLTKKQRIANVAGAFICRNDAFLDKRIVIVDDVMTTGSTINACAKEIRKNGSKSIKVVTLARKIFGGDS